LASVVAAPLTAVTVSSPIRLSSEALIGEGQKEQEEKAQHRAHGFVRDRSGCDSGWV
jgi:hypothetical protein